MLGAFLGVVLDPHGMTLHIADGARAVIDKISTPIISPPEFTLCILSVAKVFRSSDSFMLISARLQLPRDTSRTHFML
jgi:hypothetical protein